MWDANNVVAVKRGDTVRIKAQGAMRQGVVLSVDGKDGDWMIELRDPDYGYTYWKQHSDGGQMQLIESGPEPMTLRRAVKEARDEATCNADILLLVRRHYPDVQMNRGVRSWCDSYFCTGYEIVASGCPPLSVFMFSFIGEQNTDTGTLFLMDDEAFAFDSFLGMNPPLAK